MFSRIAIIYAATALFTCIAVRAQDLVPNGNFELYNNCPSANTTMPFTAGYNDFPTVQHWTNPLRRTSPDYMHTCASPASGYQIPGSTHGNKWPRSGQAYTGIIAWEANPGGVPQYDYREYIQTKLTASMQAGRQYCVRFYVSPGIGLFPAFNYVAINDIGIHFSNIREINSIDNNLQLSYDIRNTTGNFFADTAQWYKVTGVYTATGGEEWLTLGSFKTLTAPTSQQLYPLTPDPLLLSRAYLFIEDVSVTEITPADTITNIWDTLVCTSGNLNISLQGVSDAVAYLWQDGSHMPTFIAGDTGIYWCRAILECGQVTDTFRILFRQPNHLDLGPDTINCLAQPVLLQANHTYDSYLWHTGAQTNTITAAQPGSYILTVSDTCGQQTDTIEVSIYPPTPMPEVRDTVICQHTMVPQLTATGTDIRWYATPAITAGSPIQPYIYTAQAGTQTVYVTQTLNGCESDKVPLQITIRHKPVADIGDYINICEGEDTLIGKSYPDVFYVWNTGEQTCCIRPRTSGRYRLTITNDCGSSTDSVQVAVSACDSCLAMPTGFTPNRDGRNDYFSPVITCPVTRFTMRIFNRWGEQLFFTTDLQQGWDGTFRGKTAAKGVYIYLIEYMTTETKRNYFLRGNVTLIR